METEDWGLVAGEWERRETEWGAETEITQGPEQPAFTWSRFRYIQFFVCCVHGCIMPTKI